MDFTQYQEHVLRYAKPLELPVDLQHACLGLVSEAGEICDALKAAMIYGKELDVLNIKEEVGDGLWFAGLLARLLNFDYNEIVSKGAQRAARIMPSRGIGYALRLADAASALSVRIADHVEDGYPLQLNVLKEELVRYVHFLSRLAMIFEFTIVDAAYANIAKLDARYAGKGGFSADAGLNRDKDAEREAMAGAEAQE